MFSGSREEITGLARFFLEPANTIHRQYEALRAYFVEGLSSAEAARRFGYTEGSFRVLCSKFRKNPHRQFFVEPKRTPSAVPKSDRLKDDVVALRKQNLSIYDISNALEREGKSLSPVSISNILKDEGFAKLPKRSDDERPPACRPTPAEVADVRELDLEPQQFRTRFGGLFLFLPLLTSFDFDTLVKGARFPGSRMVPAPHAMRSLLGLKLFGNARHTHVMSHVFDQGLALFAGLNVIPKRAFLTEYSCRVRPEAHLTLMRRWFDAVDEAGLERGVSFDLDFHTIPFHGEEALVEKHYVSKRSRRQKGVLAFLAQDAETRVFCFAASGVRKAEQNDQVLRFVEFWKQRTGRLPQELVFDSKLTTYANLDRLNQMGIDFMTLRRRSKKMLEAIYDKPLSAWRKIRLDGVSRAYRNPRVLDEKISLTDYQGFLRQLTIANLGHEDPTILLTNQLRRSATKLVERYAQRMIIENGIADGIDFFHMDALSSAVAMKVDLDLQLTLMASSLYRLFAARIGNGYRSAKSRTLFRDFIDASANVSISDDEVQVRFQKRAHNPLLLAAGFAEEDTPVPWLGNRRLRLVFG